MTLHSVKKELCVFLEELLGFVLTHASVLLFGFWFRWRRRDGVPSTAEPTLLQPATVLARRIRAGDLKSVDVIKAYVKRIREVNPSLNAVVDARFEEALAEAEDIDRRISKGSINWTGLPLLGVPFTVKNNVAVKGCVFDAGSLYWKGQRADEDAAVVSLMRRAGAIPLAISNVPELCLSSDCSNMVYGTTRNPYDTNRSPGGSSGGEGSLLASAASVIGIGTDMAGSIRIPAYRCGIFGHKPTHGVVSSAGMFPDLGENQRRLGSPGPMCRYARDLDVALRVMAGENAPRLRLDSPVDLKKLKIFYTVDNGNEYFTSIDKSLSQAVLDVVRSLEMVCEARPQRVTFPETRRGFSMWMACLEPGTVSFAAMFKRFAETLNPFRELLLKLAGRSNHTMASIWATLGGSLSKDTSSATAAADLSRARDFTRKLEDLLGDDGVLIFPCSGMKVPYQNQLFSVYTNHGFTCIFNVAMVPVTACPLYLDDEGLPVGVQVVAARYQDRICLAVARELESRFKFGWKAPGTIPRL